jgi:hypothetical protein
MTFQESVLNSIEDVFRNNTVISISGEAGTGKTSISLFLVGKFLTAITPYEGSCIWVQASESFSKRRLESLFKDDEKRLTYLQKNIFVTPGDGSFSSFDTQLSSLQRLSDPANILPPDLEFIVVDNISHHLRYKLSRITDVSLRSNILNTFYDSALTPLIFRCHREKINLLLLHEVSFNVSSQQTRPYFSKLYDRLRGVQIVLLKSPFSDKRTIEVKFGGKQFSLAFDLIEKGFNFLK